MAICCAAVVLFSLASLILSILDQESFVIFEVLAKLVTASAMYLSFRSFKWDVVKGLMGSVLFALMYQEAHLVLNVLRAEENFDTYLVAGVHGSIYLATSGMAFLMTVIITINHFFINYAFHGNPKNVILNRIAILFKFIVYLQLFISNGQLALSRTVLIKNAFLFLTDFALLLLLVSMESQFDSFNSLRQKLLKIKREKRKKELVSKSVSPAYG